MPVKRGLVALRPPTLTGRATTLEYVLELLLARAATEDRFTQGKLRSEAPGKYQPKGGGLRRGAWGLGMVASKCPNNVCPDNSSDTELYEGKKKSPKETYSSETGLR